VNSQALMLKKPIFSDNDQHLSTPAAAQPQDQGKNSAAGGYRRQYTKAPTSEEVSVGEHEMSLLFVFLVG
jgi:hypothetical protein